MNVDDSIQTSIEGLGEILLGGIPRGNVILAQGPTGAGKTVLGTTTLLSHETGVLPESIRTQQAAAFLTDKVIRLDPSLVRRRRSSMPGIVKSRGHDYDDGLEVVGEMESSHLRHLPR